MAELKHTSRRQLSDEREPVHLGDGQGDPQVEHLDPAQQSLSDALRVSFGILKVAMVLLLVAYLFSGFFTVTAQEAAVRLRFGEIVGAPGEQVYTEGWHLGLPYPIEQVIKVSVAPQTVQIGRAFWYDIGAMGGSNTPLNPERDGSLLTGDANIVHGKFSVTYHVSDPAAFIRNVGDLRLANELVRSVMEQSIVHAVAQTEADTFLSGRGLAPAEVRAEQLLADMGAGIEIDTLSVDSPTVPPSVVPAFRSVNEAKSARAQLIESARQEQARILGETAGEAALPARFGAEGPLMALIRQYETARQLRETEQARELLAQIDEAFRTLTLTTEQGEVRIGAQAAQVINEALAYKTNVEETTKSQLNTLQELLAEGGDSPLLRSRLWQNAREQILTGDVETIYSMPGEPYIVTNRDPAIQRQRELQRREQDEQAREQRRMQPTGP